jgi:hypothetical protein
MNLGVRDGQVSVHINQQYQCHRLGCMNDCTRQCIKISIFGYLSTETPMISFSSMSSRTERQTRQSREAFALTQVVSNKMFHLAKEAKMETPVMHR